MKTFLDWSAYRDAGMGDAYADIPKHGDNWAKAIAVCINSRQCEADGKQLMCPSYKVSGNENLSTGGRVRLLKAALNGDPEHLFKPDVIEAMDLCVSCKGCKRECENNVDMPLIKAEYMAHYRQKFGTSARSLLLASTPVWLFRLPWLGRLLKWRNKSGLLARLMEKALGFSATVPMPVPSSRPFSDHPFSDRPVKDRRNKEHLSKEHFSKEHLSGETCGELVDPDSADVVLLVDTFNRYFEPQVPTAALELLMASGYRVALAPVAEGERPLCCGRTWLAQGMIEHARREAERLVRALAPLAVAGKTIVGLEASCVLGMRDDMLALGLAGEGESDKGLQDDAVRVSKSVLLLEEFLARELKAGNLQLPSAQSDTETLVHGHCHQKAVGAMKSVRRLLKDIPNHKFNMIDASCCGMAGSFGLEAEHAAISLQMAEHQLLPALAEKPGATVIANGFSCRQQLRSHSQARPMHLAEYLNSLRTASSPSD